MKFVISKVLKKTTKEGKLYEAILCHPMNEEGFASTDGKWFNVFEYGPFSEDQTIEAEVVKRGEYENLVAIKVLDEGKGMKVEHESVRPKFKKLLEKSFVFTETPGQMLYELMQVKDETVNNFRQDHNVKADIITGVLNKDGYLILVITLFYEE
jgi:hypothetical protein